MPAPLDTTRLARTLLSDDDREVIDRATFLPIGQYEDGSLTLAWPGLLKDAYEGAVRSYEQGRQLPRADEEGYYAGTPRAEPLDAFNAASVGPVSGVVGRAAGAIPRGALGSGGSDVFTKLAEQPTGIRAFRGTENSGQLKIRSDTPFFSSDKEIAGSYAEFFDDPVVHEAFLNFQNPYTLDAGGRRWDRISHNGKITTTDDLAAFAAKQGHDGLVVNNVIDPPTDGIDEVLRPSSVYAALRRGTVTGRNGDLLFANPTESSLPYLMTNGMEGEQVASADPMRGFPPVAKQPEGLSEFKGMLMQEGFVPPPPPSPMPPQMIEPEQLEDLDFWQKFHDEQFYKNTPRELLPPGLKKPIEVPDTDRWWNLVTQR